jgi:hypothetical protein
MTAPDPTPDETREPGDVLLAALDAAIKEARRARKEASRDRS